MKKWISDNKLFIIGAGIGCIAGFFYWQQIGCASGTCMITSSPVNSSIYGATMGALLLGSFKKNREPVQEPKIKNDEI
jgi:Family of unknown function (DUF6132)